MGNNKIHTKLKNLRAKDRARSYDAFSAAFVRHPS